MYPVRPGHTITEEGLFITHEGLTLLVEDNARQKARADSYKRAYASRKAMDPLVLIPCPDIEDTNRFTIGDILLIGGTTFTVGVIVGGLTAFILD